GDGRQYSFMMFENPNRENITDLQLPAKGEAFNATEFQAENGLKDAVAGVAMVVKLGGKVDCGESPAALNATAEALASANSTLAANSTEVANSTAASSSAISSATASAVTKAS